MIGITEKKMERKNRKKIQGRKVLITKGRKKMNYVFSTRQK